MDEKYEALSKKIHVPDALNARVLAAAEELERKPQPKKSGGKVLRLVQKAAVAAVIAMLLPITAYAAVQLFGLQAYLANSGMENTEAVQELYSGELEGEGHQNQYARYTIVEAVCDREVIYLAAKITPLDDSTFLVPQHVMKSDAVYNLNIPGATEGTVGEYAASLGKQLASVSVAYYMDGEPVSQSESFSYGEDGALYLYHSARNSSGRENITLTCVATGVDESLSMDRLDRVEFEVELFDKSSAQENVYYALEGPVAEETGIQVKSVYIMETELGLYGKIAFTCADPQRLSNLSLRLVTASGELKHLPGFTGTGITDNGDGQFTTMLAYQKPTTREDLSLVVWDYVQEIAYGPYDLK